MSWTLIVGASDDQALYWLYCEFKLHVFTWIQSAGCVTGLQQQQQRQRCAENAARWWCDG